MPSKITKVALAGAGFLGVPVIERLLAAGYEVTALTRESSSTVFPAGVKVAKVNYESEDSLRQALRGQEALISTLTTAAVDTQIRLFDAAFAEGVLRIIPSEFGSDTLNDGNRKSPVYAQKIQIQEYLETKVKDSKTSYTAIINGIFLDWGIKFPFLLNAKEKEINLYDGGDTEYSATTLENVAKAVVGVLSNLDATANRFVKIDSAVLSQRKLLELAKKALGSDGWTVSEPSTAEIEAQGFQVLQTDPGNVMGWVVPLLTRANFAAERNAKLTGTENELLGVSKTNNAELEALILEAPK